MPVMDGLEFISSYSSKKTTKFIILSGYGEFEYARAAQTAAGSGAKLFYNDYVGMASPGQMKAVVKYLADAKAAGTIDGLGMQAHQTNLNVSDGDNIKNALNSFKQNGYEVQITELDFASKDNSESGQETLANAYSKFMNIVLTQKNSNNVNVSGVTFWNLTDLDTWLNTQKNDGAIIRFQQKLNFLLSGYVLHFKVK